MTDNEDEQSPESEPNPLDKFTRPNRRGFLGFVSSFAVPKPKSALLAAATSASTSPIYISPELRKYILLCEEISNKRELIDAHLENYNVWDETLRLGRLTEKGDVESVYAALPKLVKAYAAYSGAMAEPFLYTKDHKDIENELGELWRKIYEIRTQAYPTDERTEEKYQSLEELYPEKTFHEITNEVIKWQTNIADNNCKQMGFSGGISEVESIYFITMLKDSDFSDTLANPLTHALGILQISEKPMVELQRVKKVVFDALDETDLPTTVLDLIKNRFLQTLHLGLNEILKCRKLHNDSKQKESDETKEETASRNADAEKNLPKPDHEVAWQHAWEAMDTGIKSHAEIEQKRRSEASEDISKGS